MKAYWVNWIPLSLTPSGFILPVVNITIAVIVRTRKVSMNTLTIATIPCSTGWLTLATAWACGVEPIPASFEKSPLETPYLTDSLTVAPISPPVTAWGLNAPSNIILNAIGML